MCIMKVGGFDFDNEDKNPENEPRTRRLEARKHEDGDGEVRVREDAGGKRKNQRGVNESEL